MVVLHRDRKHTGIQARGTVFVHNSIVFATTSTRHFVLLNMVAMINELRTHFRVCQTGSGKTHTIFGKCSKWTSGCDNLLAEG